ncbi:hypothetical protein DP939_43340 [Spongiactinospora rosea]|uniref:Uncharacterized protein n=1 Tax=Spongiactinospora rosea TaxID=2248750 RepID=A0A366LJ57_9ACTN|nr:DUF6236 family protein [Spongiactinospora rosea]RBQ13927.1 hypothetical protein DP939_43340 [Spongiactinospora rosea]
MTGGAIPAHGLYYPFFRMRDDSWLKAMALYWPKIVRLVPASDDLADYMARPRSHPTVPVHALTRDVAYTMRVLTEELGVVERVPPGASVQAVARSFEDALSRPSLAPLRLFRAGTAIDPSTVAAPLHRDEVAPRLRTLLSEQGFAYGLGASFTTPAARELPLHQRVEGPTADTWDLGWHRWAILDSRLVRVYKSMLAHEFARANKLQPITDISGAYVASGNWDADHIEAALTSPPPAHGPAERREIAQTIAYLALNLVIPRGLSAVPVEKIVELRRRYGNEFIAFGMQVDQVAAELGDLTEIRDTVMLTSYLESTVANRFARPLADLRKQMKTLGLDAATMAINVKTEIPAGVAVLGGGALLAGHPVIAATTSAAIGLIGLRRSVQDKRDAILQAEPAASYLLHTGDALRPRSLLQRSLRQVHRITGTASS